MSETSSQWLRRMNLAWPIIQAPMAGVSTPAMAVAVSNAGALGSIGVGAASVDEAARMIDDVRRGTHRPFNVNVFCHRPARARSDVERAWIDRLAPRFAEAGAAPPLALREIYTSFLVDDAMLAMFLERKPPIVSFHFGVPDAERMQALRAARSVQRRHSMKRVCSSAPEPMPSSRKDMKPADIAAYSIRIRATTNSALSRSHASWLTRSTCR